MRCRRTSAIPAPPYGSGRRPLLPPRSHAVRRFASAAHYRFPVSSSQYRLPPRHVSCTRRFLLTHAAILGNHVQMPLTLCGRSLGPSRSAPHSERGGTMTAAAGWWAAISPQRPSWLYAPSPVNEAMGPSILSSKGTNLRAIVSIVGSQCRRDDVDKRPRRFGTVAEPTMIAVITFSPILMVGLLTAAITCDPLTKDGRALTCSEPAQLADRIQSCWSRVRTHYRNARQS
jgi:hypothetical protein